MWLWLLYRVYSHLASATIAEIYNSYNIHKSSAGSWIMHEKSIGYKSRM